jgi:micrococcal nuclease
MTVEQTVWRIVWVILLAVALLLTACSLGQGDNADDSPLPGSGQIATPIIRLTNTPAGLPPAATPILQRPSPTPAPLQPSPTPEGEIGTVTRVVDGDTIEVRIGNTIYDVRYVGVNTPESDEPCFEEAQAANSTLVSGQTVRLVRDVSNTDRFDRLLRYVYVGDVFVNAELVRGGWAEAVLYDPDDREYDFFRDLELAAAQANIGCHPTGIFDDNSAVR